MHPSPAHLAAAAAAHLPPAEHDYLNALAAQIATACLVRPQSDDPLGGYLVRGTHRDDPSHVVTLHDWSCTCWSNRMEGDCPHVRAALVYARALMLALEESVQQHRTAAALATEQLFSLQSQLTTIPA